MLQSLTLIFTKDSNMPFIADDEVTTPPKGFVPDEAPSSAPSFTPDAPEEVSKKPGIFSRIADFSNRSRKAYLDFNVGVLKGAGSTVMGIGELGSRGLEAGYNQTIGRLTGDKAYEGSQMARDVKQEYLTPEGTAQKVGFGTEQIAEFLVPSTAAAKSAQIAEGVASKVASKLPKLAETAKKAVPYIDDAVKLVGQAGEDVAKTVAQRGKVDEEAAKAGLYSAGGQLAGDLIGKGLQAGAEVVASRTIPSTIRELAQDVKQARSLGRAVLDTGTSLTRKGLGEKLGGKVRQLATTVDGLVDDYVQANPGVKTRATDVAGSILSSLDEGKITRDLELIPTEYAPAREAIVKQIERLTDKYPGDLDLNQVQKLKKELGTGLEKAYKIILERPIKIDRYATMQFQKTLKGIVDEAVPAAKPLNKKLGDFITARDRLFAKGSYSGYLTDIIAGTLGAGSAGSLLENPAEYVKNAAAAILFKRLGTSTLAKTASASILDDVGKVLQNPAVYQSIRKALESKPEEKQTP